MHLETDKPRTLYDKVFDSKVVADRGDGSVLLYIDRHLIYEVTSPQAFEGLRIAGRAVRRPGNTLATLDHNVPTVSRKSYRDVESFMDDEESRIQCMLLEKNVKDFGLVHFGIDDKRQGIVHVIGPEQGFTLPGTTIVCGDSHTSTHGAFGALAFGIGTSEVEHVLATQTLITQRNKNMRISVNGTLPHSVTSKDLILHIIGRIGTAGGTGAVIEYCGTVIEDLSMSARMSICNMSIEAGARAGMIAPDATTFEYLKGRPMAPRGVEWENAVRYWSALKSDKGCCYDIDLSIEAKDIAPTVTWGTSPQDVVPICGVVPSPEDFSSEQDQQACKRALEYMGLLPGTRMENIDVDTVFIGSCTNSRLEDLAIAAKILEGKTIAPNIKLAMVVPGSGLVKRDAEALGLDAIFIAAGFQWREAGCSMCVGMNSDTQLPLTRCASTSNRNFEDRQGDRVRTHLMSPATAAATAISGKLADVRKFLPRTRNPLELGPKIDIADESDESHNIIVEEMKPSKALTNEPQAILSTKPSRPSFLELRGIAAHMGKANIDTDSILAKQFCKTIKKVGLGKALFHYLRFNPDGSEKDFVLNGDIGRQSQILVATGENFGCGSSREHAAWALLDFGIKCIIAPSFADIFYNNCFKNGMLPLTIKDTTTLAKLAEEARSGRELEVDLPNQVIYDSARHEICSFEIDGFRKDCLVNGYDDIALTMLMEEDIARYERKMRIETAWLHLNDTCRLKSHQRLQNSALKVSEARPEDLKW